MILASYLFIMSRKKSALWDYFEEENDDPTNVVCKIGVCGKKISRGKAGTARSRLSNSGMRSHLKTSHAKELKEFQEKEKDQDVDKAASEQEHLEADETENAGVQLFNLNSHKKRKIFFQQNLPDMVESMQTYDINDARAKSKHRAVLTMMIVDLKPFRMVNDPGFLNYSKLLDPRFAVGSDLYYRRLLDKALNKGKSRVQRKLADDKPSDVAIQLDGWSAHRHGYMGVLLTYINKDWKRAKLCLACAPFEESHSGHNIARWLENECDQWGITDNVGVVTTDTAANMLKMMEYLPIQFSHGGCLNHVLQLVIKDELLEKASVKIIIKSCRKICTYANQTVMINQCIVMKQIELGKERRLCLNLLQDVTTRWNSTYLMLQRFLDLQPVICSILQEEEWQNKLEVTPTNADWTLMEKVVQVLGVFYEATVRFSSSAACISDVIPTVTGLLVTLKPNGREDHGVVDFKRKLRQSMKDRLGQKEELERYSLATLLDPRY